MCEGPSRPSRHLISDRRNQSLFDMALFGRYYVLGPPVQDRDGVVDLTTTVMRETPDLIYKPFTLRNLEGPVRYDSSWVPGGRRQVLREGLEVMDLWTGEVWWDNRESARSFSVIVIDQDYLDNSQGNRRKLPQFETFIVGVLQGDQPGVSRLYEWRNFLPKPNWANRGLWKMMPLEDDDPDRQRHEALDALSSGSWQLLHDVECLFAAPDAPRPSRKARRRGPGKHESGCHEVRHPPRLDVILPFGLNKFLASLVQRPRSFEQLCRVLWEMERANREHASMPI